MDLESNGQRMLFIAGKDNTALFYKDWGRGQARRLRRRTSLTCDIRMRTDRARRSGFSVMEDRPTQTASSARISPTELAGYFRNSKI